MRPRKAHAMHLHRGQARKTAVAIRHVPFEDLGNLAPSLRKHGYRIQYRDAGLHPPERIQSQVDLLIVLGGPIGAYEEDSYPFIREETRLIEDRLGRDLPTLGICLGAQMMARALGADVRPGPRKEMGWGGVALASAARASPLHHLDGVRVLHWHGDTFDIPKGAIHLASTETYENQAFSWKKSALALQFHAEVRKSSLERWYIGHACEIAATANVSVDQLRTEAERYAPSLQARAAKLWEGWLSALD